MIDAGRYWRTLRPLQLSQIAWRLWYLLRRRFRLYPRPRPPAPVPDFNRAALDRLCAHLEDIAALAPPDPEQLEAYRRNVFRFLRHTEKGMPPPWKSRSASRLWQYHLHYFGYARDLAMANIAGAHLHDRERVLDWISSWRENCPPGTDVAWDAFTIASRLMNLAFAESVLHLRDEAFRASYWQQARYLMKSLEYDIRANHLLHDAAGLVVAGALLGEPFLSRGRRLLEKEAEEQILTDGGHYERSPMYHGHVLEDLLTARAALGGDENLDRLIAKMARFLDYVLHPDGGIPLFGDAVSGEGLPPRALIALAEKNSAAQLPPLTGTGRASGYHVFAREAGHLIVKAGPPGPEYQLGHAHCDMLSYEFSAGGKRCIVDSGVHGYAGSPMRDYCRSTRAHNTVLLNGREQLEYWSVFRVGRRYRAYVEKPDPSLPDLLLRASHDGFEPLAHERLFWYLPMSGAWVIYDKAAGPGAIDGESWIHVHPDWEVSDTESGWLLRHGEACVRILTLPPAVFGIEDSSQEKTRVCGGDAPLQGWYCPEFGRAGAAPALAIRARATGILQFGYAIVPKEEEPDIREIAGHLLRGMETRRHP
jgi:uncharacterized heparinase superfamily protein